mmetsp:Transcript_41250/g.77284  ORF Transcript_41250/g.77284 Transcript_41250/m.77284 type:complete len:300 (-) Transcript_41250:424-1323(-)
MFCFSSCRACNLCLCTSSFSEYTDRISCSRVARSDFVLDMTFSIHCRVSFLEVSSCRKWSTCFSADARRPAISRRDSTASRCAASNLEFRSPSPSISRACFCWICSSSSLCFLCIWVRLASASLCRLFTTSSSCASRSPSHLALRTFSFSTSSFRALSSTCARHVSCSTSNFSFMALTSLACFRSASSAAWVSCLRMSSCRDSSSLLMREMCSSWRALSSRRIASSRSTASSESVPMRTRWVFAWDSYLSACSRRRAWPLRRSFSTASSRSFISLSRSCLLYCSFCELNSSCWRRSSSC